MNLFNIAKTLYGYVTPNYDVVKLATAVCAAHGWNLDRTYFYVGLPDESVDPRRHHWWNAKIREMRTNRNLIAWTRMVRYSTDKAGVLYMPGGYPVGREKGCDLRLALDVAETMFRGQFDVAILFSVDQDFRELVGFVRRMRPALTVACAHPIGSTPLTGSVLAPYDRPTYDACIDPIDYRTRVSLNERAQIKADVLINEISTKWDRRRVNVTPIGTISGTLRSIIPVTGRPGFAYVCVDDGTNLQVAELQASRWKFFDRHFGTTTTLYVDANGDWSHLPPPAIPPNPALPAPVI